MEMRYTIPQNTRVDIAKDNIDTGIFKSYGSVIDSGANTIRIFTFESAIKELTELAIRKNLSFTVSPITLDDVFVSLVGRIEEERKQARTDLKNDTVAI